MKRTLLVASALALSLTALPAMAQGYYSRYDTPITGAQMSDYPSSRANTTLTGSMLSVGSRYDYDRAAYNRERDSYDRYYDRDRDYRYDRDRDYYGR